MMFVPAHAVCLRLPVLVGAVVAALLGAVAARAQVVTGTAAFSSAPAAVGAPQGRVPDRVWSTQHRPAPPPGVAQGVVVLSPNVVLGWGGLPPNPPLGAPPPPGGPVGGLRPPPPRVLVVPGSGATPGTLHHWRSP